MFDKYVDTFFPDEFEIDEEKRDEKYEDLIGGVFTKDFAEKHLEKVTYETTLEKEETPDKPNDVSTSDWQEYEHGHIQLTQQFYDKMDELSLLAASPLIPNDLRELIMDFQSTVQENIYTIGETLTEVSEELPKQYNTPEKVMKFNPLWISNVYNKKSKNLKKPADKILQYLNDYLSIEELKDMS